MIAGTTVDAMVSQGPRKDTATRRIGRLNFHQRKRT
jgi:hypothetical protein